MQTAEQILEHYIKKANSYPFKVKLFDSYYATRPINKVVFELWYREATFVYQLQCSFEKFKWLIENKTTRLYRNYRWKPAKFSWSWNHEQRHRVCRKFVKRPHHKKKELSEEQITKREWRERKGFAKDKSKAYWRRGAGKYYKRFSNQMHRAYVKQQIINKNWDNLCNNDYKYFLDPWLWD